MNNNRSEAARLMGKIKSPAKAAAARANGQLGGKLGGRPLKTYILCFETWESVTPCEQGGCDFRVYNAWEEQIQGYRNARARRVQVLARHHAAGLLGCCILRSAAQQAAKIAQSRAKQ